VTIAGQGGSNEADSLPKMTLMSLISPLRLFKAGLGSFHGSTSEALKWPNHFKGHDDFRTPIAGSGGWTHSLLAWLISSFVSSSRSNCDTGRPAYFNSDSRVMTYSVDFILDGENRY
jgi:hypothetical protein